MSSETAPAAKYRTPLRQAQRDLTRGRIKDAARTLFYEQHFETTTMDQIAHAAGLRRSTVYLHYRDKSEILGEVIADYTPKARAALEQLPGPAPSRQQLDRWIRRVMKVVATERVPLSIILELRRDRTHDAALRRLTSELLAGLGRNNAPFRDAAREGAEPMLRARAFLLLQELTHSCGFYLDDPADPFNRALLETTVGDFHAFLAEGAARAAA